MYDRILKSILIVLMVLISSSWIGVFSGLLVLFSTNLSFSLAVSIINSAISLTLLVIVTFIIISCKKSLNETMPNFDPVGSKAMETATGRKDILDDS